MWIYNYLNNKLIKNLIVGLNWYIWYLCQGQPPCMPHAPSSWEQWKAVSQTPLQLRWDYVTEFWPMTMWVESCLLWSKVVKSKITSLSMVSLFCLYKWKEGISTQELSEEITSHAWGGSSGKEMPIEAAWLVLDLQGSKSNFFGLSNWDSGTYFLLQQHLSYPD